MLSESRAKGRENLLPCPDPKNLKEGDETKPTLVWEGFGGGAEELEKGGMETFPLSQLKKFSQLPPPKNIVVISTDVIPFSFITFTLYHTPGDYWV